MLSYSKISCSLGSPKQFGPWISLTLTEGMRRSFPFEGPSILGCRKTHPVLPACPSNSDSNFQAWGLAEFQSTSRKSRVQWVQSILQSQRKPLGARASPGIWEWGGPAPLANARHTGIPEHGEVGGVPDEGRQLFDLCFLVCHLKEVTAHPTTWAKKRK